MKTFEHKKYIINFLRDAKKAIKRQMATIDTFSDYLTKALQHPYFYHTRNLLST